MPLTPEETQILDDIGATLGGSLPGPPRGSGPVETAMVHAAGLESVQRLCAKLIEEHDAAMNGLMAEREEARKAGAALDLIVRHIRDFDGFNCGDHLSELLSDIKAEIRKTSRKVYDDE